MESQLMQELAACKRTASVQAHALVFPFPLVGHINPLLYIARVLASSYGFKVTFLTTEYRLNQLKEQKIIQEREEEHINVNFINFEVVPASAGISAHYHEGIDGPVRLLTAFRSISQSGAFEHWLQELHEKKGHPLSCIISDTLFSWTQPLADKLGIPRASFWGSTATSYALYSHASLLLNHPPYHGHLPGNEVGKDDLEMPLKVPGICHKLPTSALPIERILRDKIPHMELDKNCTWLMFNSSKHIDAEPLQSIKVILPNTELLAIVTNPLPFSKEMCVSSSRAKSCNEHVNISTATTYSSTRVFENKEDLNCLDWLDSKPTSSVIYIAFGSIVSLEREKLQELALGLENSKKSFLWVLRSRKTNIPNDKCIKDSNLLPEGFVERTHKQGLIISWAPQLQVLAHPSVGCFLTHCGWNSIMESLSCGVPLLGLPPPAFSDMKIVGWYIEHVWQVGLHLVMDKLSKVDVEKALETLMGQNSGTANFYRENATRISKAFQLTTPQEELKLFAQEVIKRAHSNIVAKQ